MGSIRRVGIFLLLAGTASALLMAFGGNVRILGFLDALGDEVGLVVRFAIIVLGLGLYVFGPPPHEPVVALPAPKAKPADLAFYGLSAVTAALFVYTIRYTFYTVPIEATMGIVQKIFYFHVPAAYAMYVGATACFVGSIGLLARGTLVWDAVARAGADAAVVFGLMVIVTGPLWAAKAWGVYWTWDPRLTTMMLSVLIYVAYVVLRTFSGGGESERKFAAALGILGAATLPIIHLAVRKWGGTHPQVITGKGKGLSDPSMGQALGVAFLAFTLLTVLLVWARARQHVAEALLDEAEEEAIEHGLVEE
jgi:heme exporter protein C